MKKLVQWEQKTMKYDKEIYIFYIIKDDDFVKDLE